MKITKINRIKYIELLNKCDNRDQNPINYYYVDQLCDYRTHLQNHFMWLNQSRFQKLIEKAVARKISISVFFEDYFSLYSRCVTNQVSKYENNLITQGKLEFQKIQTVNFCYPQHIEFLNEWSNSDLIMMYDEYDPNSEGLTNSLGFSMNDEDVWIHLVLKILPHFQTYENIEFEINNQTFTISKFLSGTYLNCLFINCTFKNVRFNDQNFANCKFVNCVFKETSFYNVDLQVSQFKQCEFNDVIFTKIYTKECYFHECNLINVFWDMGLILDSEFEECKFQKSEALSLTCTNTTFRKDDGWITVSLDGLWDFEKFLNDISIES